MQHTDTYTSPNQRAAENIDAVVLAAGKSSRFTSLNSKLLFPLSGRPLLLHLLDTLKQLQLTPIIVTGHQEEQIKALLQQDRFFSLLPTVTQHVQKGTAHAVHAALPLVQKNTLLVVNGDMPLISPQTLSSLISAHQTADADITLATATTEKPRGYGRVITTETSLYIQEDKNCSAQEALCTTINAGIYIFKKDILEHYIQKMSADKASGEYFLPDIINAALQDHCSLKTSQVDFEEIQGINTLAEAHTAQAVLQKKIIDRFIKQGVTFTQPETVVIESSCNIDPYALIGPGAIITNNSHVGSHAQIGAYAVLDHAHVGPSVQIRPHSVISQSIIENNAIVGPFAHVHTNTHLDTDTRIGNFVEVKKSSLGKKSKAKHLSYLGDSIIGESVNIGAGTITCNYDGFNKHQTIIHNHASIGAHTALVAPVTIEQGAITAAGSTITEHVPAEALAIARARQVNKEGYAKKRKERFESVTKPSPITEQSL